MTGHKIRLLAAACLALPLCLLLATAQQPAPLAARGDLSKARAHWLTRDTIAWQVAGEAANTYRLYFDPAGALHLNEGGISGGNSIQLTFDPNGLTPTLRAKFPHLAGFAALKLSQADLNRVPAILKGQIAVVAMDVQGHLLDATSVQIPGVLDDLYTYKGALGLTLQGSVPTLKLWAPTAQTVRLHLFNDSKPTTTSRVVPMTVEKTGVWSATGDASWVNKFYLYEVNVFVPATGHVERNLVTDPYSLSLSTNSQRSQIVNLDDPNLKPPGWDTLHKPALNAPEDIVIYELHLRDFSINDASDGK